MRTAQGLKAFLSGLQLLLQHFGPHRESKLSTQQRAKDCLFGQTAYGYLNGKYIKSFNCSLYGIRSLWRGSVCRWDCNWSKWDFPSVSAFAILKNQKRIEDEEKVFRVHHMAHQLWSDTDSCWSFSSNYSNGTQTPDRSHHWFCIPHFQLFSNHTEHMRREFNSISIRLPQLCSRTFRPAAFHQLTVLMI